MAADGEKQPLKSAPSCGNVCGAPPSPGNNGRDSERPSTRPSTTTMLTTTDAQQQPSELSTCAVYGSTSTQDNNLGSSPSLLRQSGEVDTVNERISGYSDRSGGKSQESEIHFDEQGTKDRTSSYSSPRERGACPTRWVPVQIRAVGLFFHLFILYSVEHKAKLLSYSHISCHVAERFRPTFCRCR